MKTNVHPTDNRRTILEIGCALGLMLALLLTASFQQYSAACDAVCADTLRLHILANSDTLHDQLLKLKVRDAVLTEMETLVQNAAGQAEAVAAVRSALPRLQQVATHALRAQHSAQTVAVRLQTTTFAAKDYGDFRLPAGDYTALRIELGEAAGHNWFCVLYPALCVGASEGSYAAQAENAVVFGGYEVRFALLDSLRSLQYELKK